jgi:phosphotriesterase-related protein
MQHYWPGFRGWDEEEYVEKARGVLRHLHETRGVDTILDPTVPGQGRNIRAVARALEGTGLQAVVATGWYLFNELPLALTFAGADAEATIRELVELFVRDITEGLEGTSIKPGVIKCSTDRLGVTPHIELVLRAAARTHVKTGLPITTHTVYSNAGGLAQQKIFQQEGVDLGAVVIGHCDDHDDLDYVEQLIENGSYVGFDRCGVESPVASLEAQLDNLAELCRRGYADRIVLSHDNMVFLDFRHPEDLGKNVTNFPYGHIQEDVVPGLEERGISAADVQTMLVENPKAYFSRAAS